MQDLTCNLFFSDHQQCRETIGKKMECTEGSTIRRPRRKTYWCVLVFPLLLTVGACASTAPRYQPLPTSGYVTASEGYLDFQIDETTYLVLYTHENYFLTIGQTGFEEHWVQNSQDYALFRAGELAKSKGAKYFTVLHKDDWNVIRFARGSIIRPGSSLIVRLVRSVPSSSQPRDERMYDVDQLLNSLSESNRGLATYEGKVLPETSLEKASGTVRRWRSLVGAYDAVPLPSRTNTTLFGTEYRIFERGSMIVPHESLGEFQVAIWDSTLISPFELLSHCVTLADREGYEVFTLRNWVVEEYRTEKMDFLTRIGPKGPRKVWFRTTARVVLQHQREPESLDPVFVVDEIRSNVNLDWDKRSNFIWRH
ncbi:MAG: hypothetical protein KF722_03490 [Nitrospira sp.]|nr:hypothetical protein [Nitrospira sp.]